MTATLGPSTAPAAGAIRDLSRHRQRLLAIGCGIIAAATLLAFAARRGDGSVTTLASLGASTVALVWLAWSVRRFGIFTVGGTTCATVAILFIGRWFFPPVSGSLLTPVSAAYYNRPRALMASALMIVVFAATYSLGSRILTLDPNPRRPLAPPAPGNAVDLVFVFLFLVSARIVIGVYLNIGIPGKAPTAIPFAGVIYYLCAYGPLVAVSLLLWYGRANRTSSILSGTLLLVWALIEGALGSHGSTFQAILVFGATRSMIYRPLPIHSIRTIVAVIIVCAAIAAGLFLSFISRESLNGGARQSLTDVPAFVFNRFGGLEYLAPVVGAVDATGTDLRRVRTSTWNRYMTVTVYGLPADARTGFAATAIGWWYGLDGLKGVMVGAAITGLLGGQFDRSCQRRRAWSGVARPTLALGVILGWATFLLGGTIGSLGGIAIGFTGIAIVMERFHRLIVSGRGISRSRNVRRIPGLTGNEVP